MPRRPLEIRPGIRRLFRLAVRRPADTRAEVDEEIRLHLQLRAEQLIRSGLSPDAARAEAERRFGSLDEARTGLHAEAARQERRAGAREWAEEVGRDVRLSLRRLGRAPGFVVTVVTCVALGVGANAAAFSLLDELLLRP